MLKIPRKKNGKKRRDERVEDIRVQEYGDCSRNKKEEAEKKEVRQDKKTKRRCIKKIKEEVKENQPALRAGWDGNDKNRSISNQKNYASKDKNSSSLIILTPSSFAFLFLEEAEAESLLIR